eukprot:TRINITY_DN14181_c0_g1_i1.p1 TRINITY_DN14181_c0_g1~~TRINITY_DN14181_c0_g1_i1.p1  ORF type:complete len:528 (+),score=96.67 TRINITY_DN14181_c0_g1_i1:60-1586(+)
MCIRDSLGLIKLGKGEFIFMEGDPAEEMFFIKSGKVAAVIPEHDNFKFMKIKIGGFFGEMDLIFYDEKRKYTFMSTRDTELYVLNKKNFKSVFFQEFRDIGMEVLQIAFERKVRMKGYYQEALKLCRQIKRRMQMKKATEVQGLNGGLLRKSVMTKLAEIIKEEKDDSHSVSDSMNSDSHLEISFQKGGVTQTDEEMLPASNPLFMPSNDPNSLPVIGQSGSIAQSLKEKRARMEAAKTLMDLTQRVESLESSLGVIHNASLQLRQKYVKETKEIAVQTESAPLFLKTQKAGNSFIRNQHLKFDFQSQKSYEMYSPQRESLESPEKNEYVPRSRTSALKNFKLGDSMILEAQSPAARLGEDLPILEAKATMALEPLSWDKLFDRSVLTVLKELNDIKAQLTLLPKSSLRSLKESTSFPARKSSESLGTIEEEQAAEIIDPKNYQLQPSLASKLLSEKGTRFASPEGEDSDEDAERFVRMISRKLAVDKQKEKEKYEASKGKIFNDDIS